MNPPLNSRPATDNGLDWKTLPWVLMVLGALLLASQLLNPGQGQQAALTWYESSGLRQLEWNNYLSWLRFNGHAEQARRLEQQIASGNPHAYADALLSAQFEEDSNKRAGDFWSASQITQWKALREQIPQQLEQSPQYRWGLSAVDPRPSRFFTAPFTGGPLWLTLLALLCLGLVAVRLQRQLGTGRIVVIWLAGSLLSGAGYLLTVGTGQTPLFGAAPALMALLAAAAALSRQPIVLPLPAGKGEEDGEGEEKKEARSLTLPAWTPALLPLVLLTVITLTQAPMLPQLLSGLAAGLGGALLALLLQPPAATQSIMAESPAEPLNPELQQALTHGWDALGKLEGESAERHFREALKHQPDQFDALTGLFTAQLIQQPVSQDWHHTADCLFNHPASEPGQATQVAHLWKQYRQHQPEPLPEATLWQLVMTLTLAREFQQAEQLAMQHAEYSDEKERRKAALDYLRAALLKEGLYHRAKALPV